MNKLVHISIALILLIFSCRPDDENKSNSVILPAAISLYAGNVQLNSWWKLKNIVNNQTDSFYVSEVRYKNASSFGYTISTEWNDSYWVYADLPTNSNPENYFYLRYDLHHVAYKDGVYFSGEVLDSFSLSNGTTYYDVLKINHINNYSGLYNRYAILAKNIGLIYEEKSTNIKLELTDFGNLP